MKIETTINGFAPKVIKAFEMKLGQIGVIVDSEINCYGGHVIARMKDRLISLNNIGIWWDNVDSMPADVRLLTEGEYVIIKVVGE